MFSAGDGGRIFSILWTTDSNLFLLLAEINQSKMKLKLCSVVPHNFNGQEVN